MWGGGADLVLTGGTHFDARFYVAFCGVCILFRPVNVTNNLRSITLFTEDSVRFLHCNIFSGINVRYRLLINTNSVLRNRVCRTMFVTLSGVGRIIAVRLSILSKSIITLTLFMCCCVLILFVYGLQWAHGVLYFDIAGDSWGIGV